MDHRFSVDELLLIRQHITDKTPEEIAALLNRPVEEIIEEYNDLLDSAETKKKIRYLKLQQEAKSRHLSGVRIVSAAPKPPGKLKKPVKRNRSIAVMKREEKQRLELKKQQEAKDKKIMRDLEENRKIKKEREFKRRSFKTRQTDYAQLKTVRVDAHTVIFLKPGEDPETAKEHYWANASKNKIRMKIKEHNF